MFSTQFLMENMMENLKKNKKFPQPGFEPTTLKKRVTFERVTKEESLFKE